MLTFCQYYRKPNQAAFMSLYVHCCFFTDPRKKLAISTLVSALVSALISTLVSTLISTLISTLTSPMLFLLVSQKQT